MKKTALARRIGLALLAVALAGTPALALAQVAGSTGSASTTGGSGSANGNGGAVSGGTSLGTASPLAAQQGGVATPSDAPSSDPGSMPAAAQVGAPGAGTPSPAVTATSPTTTTTSAQGSSDVPWFWLIFTIVVAALVTSYLITSRNANKPPPR